MRRMSRGTPEQQAAARDRTNLPDGVGGSVTGGPVQLIDLMEVLERGSRDAGWGGASRGGAVSGAAHIVVSNVLAGDTPERDIALSDGSRISFASLVGAGVLSPDRIRHLADA
jgi:hypothetical protein